MPSRAAIIAILLLWLAAVAWQVQRTVSAPYTAAPKLLDSLRAAVDEGETVWKITHNGKPLGRTVNDVREDRSVGYVLRQNVTLDGALDGFLNLKLVNSLLGLNLGDNLALTLASDVQVTQFGSMNRFTMNAAVHLDKQRQDSTIKAYVAGRAEENHLILTGYFTVMEQKFPLPPDFKVRYDSKNLFMSSMAPADCLPRLAPGQAWEAPMIDLSDLMASPAMGAAGGGELAMPARKPASVRVREEPVWLDWHGQGASCWLVESKQRGLVVQLWVRQADGFVLKQQAKWGDSAIELVREPKAAKPKAPPKLKADD